MGNRSAQKNCPKVNGRELCGSRKRRGLGVSPAQLDSLAGAATACWMLGLFSAAREAWNGMGCGVVWHRWKGTLHQLEARAMDAGKG